jgi:hypothetical protein
MIRSYFGEEIGVGKVEKSGGKKGQFRGIFRKRRFYKNFISDTVYSLRIFATFDNDNQNPDD